MRSPWSTRLLRAFLALWFALSATELGGAHACPTHDGVATASTHAGAEHGGHGGHATTAASAAETTHEGSHSQHVCTCVGMGCGSASVAFTASAPVVPAMAVATREVDRPLDRADVRIERAVHLLPFAIGPPARVLTA